MPEHLPVPVKTFGYCTTLPTHLAPPKMGDRPGWAAATIARGNRFVVVAIEYFTRWIEAKPLTNEKQFDSDNFKEFCKSIGTKVAFTLVYHPESNGAVERANRVIFSVIAKTLFNLRKGK